MKKVLLSVTGITMIVLLLAALGGAALASPAESVSSDIPEAPVSVDEAIKEAAPAIVSTVRDEVAVKAIELSVVKGLIGRKQGGVQVLTDDDDPEGEHPEGGCGGYIDSEKLVLKIAAAAQFLGLTPEEIAAQLQAGKRLYQVAAEQGVDVQAFREAVHAVVNENGGCGCGTH